MTDPSFDLTIEHVSGYRRSKLHPVQLLLDVRAGLIDKRIALSPELSRAVMAEIRTALIGKEAMRLEAKLIKERGTVSSGYYWSIRIGLPDGATSQGSKEITLRMPASSYRNLEGVEARDLLQSVVDAIGGARPCRVACCAGTLDEAGQCDTCRGFDYD